jgi:hypothetical protein
MCVCYIHVVRALPSEVLRAVRDLTRDSIRPPHMSLTCCSRMPFPVSLSHHYVQQCFKLLDLASRGDHHALHYSPKYKPFCPVMRIICLMLCFYNLCGSHRLRELPPGCRFTPPRHSSLPRSLQSPIRLLRCSLSLPFTQSSRPRLECPPACLPIVASLSCCDGSVSPSNALTTWRILVSSILLCL